LRQVRTARPERTGETAAVRWRVDLIGLRQRACATAGRNLTADEFDRYDIGDTYRVTCPELPPEPQRARLARVGVGRNPSPW
jgi:hypothetical protein